MSTLTPDAPPSQHRLLRVPRLLLSLMALSGLACGGDGDGQFGSGDGGSATCTMEGGCGSGGAGKGECVVGDKVYASGESFNDGCNDCTCGADGSLSCTNAYCGPLDCHYLGTSYSPGASFPARDGCNTCTCADTGEAGCTKKACTCDATAEWYRDYQTTDASSCASASIGCPPNTVPFDNDCGCGCEQDTLCAERYDCKTQGCNVRYLKLTCPYSIIDE